MDFEPLWPWPKVANFNRVRASVQSNCLAKNLVQIGASVWLEFCSQAELDSHTDRQTDKLQWKYNPSLISWRCNNGMTLTFQWNCAYNFGFWTAMFSLKSNNIIPGSVLKDWVGDTTTKFLFREVWIVQVKLPIIRFKVHWTT